VIAGQAVVAAEQWWSQGKQEQHQRQKKLKVSRNSVILASSSNLPNVCLSLLAPQLGVEAALTFLCKEAVRR